MRALTLLALSLLLFSLPAAAEEPPVPPPLPEEGASAREEAAAEEEAAALEPEVTIRRRGEDMVEEYRVAGRLYMVKITPAKGYPYYLIDTDGDGRFDTQRNALDNPPIYQWRLLSW